MFSILWASKVPGTYPWRLGSSNTNHPASLRIRRLECLSSAIANEGFRVERVSQASFTALGLSRRLR